jgi:hypothetical protein
VRRIQSRACSPNLTLFPGGSGYLSILSIELVCFIFDLPCPPPPAKILGNQLLVLGLDSKLRRLECLAISPTPIIGSPVSTYGGNAVVS